MSRAVQGVADDAMPQAALHHQGGTGAPVLLVHGFGADRLGWAATVPALLGDRAVWAADLPGHGRAPVAVGAGDPAALAAALARAVDGAGLTGLPVVGHSLGGAVALHLAAARPDLVARLVLIAPAGLGAELDAGFLGGFADLVGADAIGAALRRLVAREALIVPAMVAHVGAALDRPGARPALARIATATLAADPPPLPFDRPLTVIWGAEDRISSADPDRLAALPADVHVIPGAGHLPQAEAAGRVNRIIRAALGD